MINENLLEEARRKILESNRVLVVSHLRPDGDAVGSLLGVGLALEAVGKKVQMILTDGVPENYIFLSGSEKIQQSWQGPIDLSVVVDSSERDRVGPVFGIDEIPDINIDHHITNRGFAKINLINSNAAATSEILYNILPMLDLPITCEVSNALLAGILTDTIGFRTGSVSPGTLRSAADLMERGADLADLYKKTLASRSFAALLYWGRGLGKLNFENGLVWTTLTIEDRSESGYNGRDDADLINILSAMKEVDIALILIEQTNGSVKISWRAQNGFDVSQVAEYFGGGGHRAASGVEIKGLIHDVQEDVLIKTRDLLRNKESIEDYNDE